MAVTLLGVAVAFYARTDSPERSSVTSMRMLAGISSGKHSTSISLRMKSRSGGMTPEGDAGSGTASVKVKASLQGLTEGVTYHFRLVATNQYGTTTSPDQTFGFYPPNCPNAQLRQETRSNTLPDCRAYELVTPSFANGASAIPPLTRKVRPQ